MLQNFRNYQNLDLLLQGSPVILTGPNGAGKTNILEALSFLSPGRGLRSIKLSQVTNLAKRNQGEPYPATWAVAATVETAVGSVQLGTALDHTTTGQERRLIKINEQLAKNQAALTDWVSVIWLTPQMDRLFLEGAATRRKFMDRLIFALDSSHAERIHRYDHHLRERAQLLREGRYDSLWVSTLEQSIAEDGVAIVVARQQMTAMLTQAQRQGKDYPFPQFRGEMFGEAEEALATRPALAVEDLYKEKLKKCRPQDAEAGGASIGPHRSDFQVHHLAKQLPAELCSTGEQKMLLLALTLAFTQLQEEHRNCPTLLLLDEVVAHLDEQHRQVLFEEICHSEKESFQIWMTGTEETAFQDLVGQAQFLTVHNATLTKGF